MNGDSANGGGTAQRLWPWRLDTMENAVVRSADVVCVNSE
eukprot:CAMPEP_0194316894 /NCGR_PEP_ID=MMETSP0171-20130528/13649_1 /TAXON_ID=218684 /ORGANISM="Corethron pennatum, Strain L29A3" /LENGTH=39 /DNA_ID= /DNA_START= /DNA_END= /DNA_ORIENTATION=